MLKRFILTPTQKFINIESFSGLLLLGVTIIALIWANSPFSDSYHALWDYHIGFSSHHFSLTKPLLLWINDGLMAIFFFLIGLEVKREFILGELNSLKKIAFPMIGAIGGMSFPILFYFILNKNVETTQGWAIPMATDIAFSLAVLKALGSRIPLSLKIFLTTFAIVDDIGAVIVIAVFYSSSLKIMLLGIAMLLLLFLFILSKKGYFAKYTTIIIGAIIWLLFLKAGIHPTLAGVLIAFTIPIRQGIMTPEFTENLEGIIKKIRNTDASATPILTRSQIEQIDNLEDWTTKYQSPLQHLEHKLHDWVAYLIIPLFALANAGVTLNSPVGFDYYLAQIIAISLIAGNSIGVTSIVWISKKIKLIEIPSDITRWHIVGVGFLAGIGFTMSIFISGLSFTEDIYINSSKLGILVGSLCSAIVGYLILRFSPQKGNPKK